jgi:hypothetical protein
MPDLVRLLIAADDLVSARELMVSEDEVTTARDKHSVVTAEAVVAEAGGNLEDARSCYEDAARRWSAYGYALEEGHALLGGGRCLVGLGRRDEAGPRLEAAGAVFAGLGAQALLEETARYLDHGTALSPRCGAGRGPRP